MEKPILFNTDMVNAIIEGRKTVTRRLIDIDLGLADTDINDSSYLKIPDKYGDYHDARDLCRYRVGDILYVRETWQKLDNSIAVDLDVGEYTYIYRASDNGKAWEENMKGWRWKPSIHMPKSAARLFLKVTDIRVERLQDISEEQAISEGIKKHAIMDISYKPKCHVYGDKYTDTAIQAFSDIWDSIYKNKGYGWDFNPYVWVIDFERVYKS